MLDTLRAEMLAVLDRPNADLYCQPHPELSPLAWHVGHAIQVEHYWLCERVLGAPTDAQTHAIYFPEYTPKADRAKQLPPLDELRATLGERAQACAAAWQAAPRRHGAISSGYLRAFIAQHYAQHLETVAMADHAQRIQRDDAVHSVALTDAPPATETVWAELPETELKLGHLGDCGTPAPYDNELGAHTATVPAQQLAARPVTVAQWLAFMADGGYQQAQLWSEPGWQWRTRANVLAPWGWRSDGLRVTICQAWPGAAQADAAVVGISHYEATAYAQWAGASLPDEHAWLAARLAGLLEGVGQAWEWCRNPLAPWPGYVAFPYARYTLPWCDGRHWILKGGSAMTHQPIRRPHFRNFYTAEQRHIFAGVRLCRGA